MKRAAVLVLSLVLVGAMGSLVGVVASEMGDSLCIPLGPVILKAPEGAEVNKSSVEFPHDTHFQYSCQSCHHKWDGQKQGLSCMTSGCHDLKAAPAKSDKEPAVRYYKNAYHQMCIGCHKRLKAENLRLEMSGSILREKLPPVGPTGCMECHPK